MPVQFENITKLDIKSIDKSLSRGETPKKLVFFRGGKNDYG